MADGTITVEVSTQAAQAELERLRAENAALKRDLQFVAKVAGGAAWAWALARTAQRASA